MKTARRLLLPAIAIALVVLHCAGPSLTLMPGYAKNDFTEATLGVILMRNNITIGDPDEFAMIFGGGDAAWLFYSCFGDTFPACFKERTRFGEVIFLNGADENMSRTSERAKIGGGGEVSVPLRRNYVDSRYRYLLIVDHCSVRYDRNSGVPMLGTEGNFTGIGGGNDVATLSAMFVVWDNAKASMVAYGTVDETVAAGGDFSKKTLGELMRQTAASVARGMPFAK